MKNVMKFIAVAIVCAFVACSSSDDDNIGGSIPDKTLAGTVFNTSFTAAGGKVFMSGDDLSINITNVEADCTSSVLDYDLRVSTQVENKVGTSSTNVVFDKKGETPANVFQSTVVVESITDTQVVVKIKASTTGSNVSGTFTLPFCK